MYEFLRTSRINNLTVEHMRYAINGRFLSQRITGVQRFEREIIKELDKIVKPGEYCLVVPCDYDKNFKLDNINIVVLGKTRGILWEQVSFLNYLIKHRLIGINLGNVAPILKPDIVCIHDVKLVLNPEWFDWKYVIWSKLNYWNALVRGRLVFTVSEFSKSEIKRLYPRAKAPIEVVDEGWQHIIAVQEDILTLKRYNLEKGQYYFSLYQSIPNKNFRWIIDAAKVNENELFVVSGWNNKKTNKSEIDKKEISEIPNIRVLGYISDEEMKSLMINCKAFIFPSLYEGFGIPPLEAMALGAKVLVMNIPVMQELFEDGVQYIDEKPQTINIESRNNTKRILDRHSWVNGASKMLHILKMMEKV